MACDTEGAGEGNRPQRWTSRNRTTGILLLAVTLGIFLMTVLLMALQRTGTGKMRWFLDQTSSGRNFTALLYPEVSSQQTPGRAWMERDARKLVTIAAGRPHAGGSA